MNKTKQYSLQDMLSELHNQYEKFKQQKYNYENRFTPLPPEKDENLYLQMIQMFEYYEQHFNE